MDVILGLGGALIAILVLTQAVILIIVISRLVKLPLRAPLTVPIQRHLVEEVLPVLDMMQPELEQKGFRYMHTRRIRPLRAIDGLPSDYCDVYYHDGHDIHAEVYLADPPTPLKLCNVYLWNTFVDGSSLLTVNDLIHSLIPYPREVQIEDGNAADFSGQIATHLKARESITKTRTDPADALTIARTMAEQLLSKMAKENQVYRRGGRNGDPVYGFRFLAAVKAAWNMRRAALRFKKKTEQRSALAATTLQVPDLARASAERLAFIRTLSVLRGLRAPRWFRRTVFVFSAAAFLAIGTLWWGLAGAIAVAAVIVVHEAGHWMAMKQAGFRDVQVFFVPGMGGATSGEKHEANPMTHLMVYLAGPLPGLLLALAVFTWIAFGPEQSNESWYPLVLTGAVAAFFINAVNLLPVLPLDGGRILDLFVVGRLPWLRFIFAFGSGALLIAAGIASGDNVTRAIGIAMLIGTQHHYRVAKASAKLLHEKLSGPSVAASFSDAARQLYDFLAQPSFQKWNYNTKVTVGQALLPRLLGRLPSWQESALGLAVYASCALLPLAALLALLMMAPTQILGAVGQGMAGAYSDTGKLVQAGPPTTATASMPVDTAAMQKAGREQRKANLAAAVAQTQRLGAIKEAILGAREDDDYEDAMRLAKLFYVEAGTIAAPARERAEAALSLAEIISHGNENAKPADPEIVRLRKEAEDILRDRMLAKRDKEDALMLAQILEARVSPNDSAAMLATRQEIATLLAASMEKSDYQLADARRNLARALDRVGQIDAAEREMRAALADFRISPTSTAPALNQSIERDMAWMMISHHKLDEAVQLAESQLAFTGDNVHLANANQREAHLIMLRAARQKGDWNNVRKHAIAIRETKAPSLGNWFLDLFASRIATQYDHRTTLLLIEAERALGNGSAADKLVAEARKSYSQNARTPSERNVCRMHVFDKSWRHVIEQALSDIEQRELRCLPGAGLAITETR